ncbi:signal peptidase I [Neptunitalea lumnitzerae]|uniref:Signal peptidase I n=1 Tax=Neptunitalea lumnitzerae TaxID=2965509 RepID=A0ABQ5MFL4_9FLAO|nr:signal peptidase I [Neptunitalea sp. Y10]GLB48214.1 signal peptidase I [Neptunitalea sp. Y10]
MTFSQWLIFLLVVQVIHFAGTYKLYQRAGRKAWEALVPVYNAVVLMKIINRPKWWVVLLFLPVINLAMIPIVWVETIRSFGKNSMKDTYLGVLTLGFYIYYVNYATDAAYIPNRSLKPTTAIGEWTNSILFAVVAATFVHMYIMQPFVIPSSSLEKSLLVGDFLFVSKFHYGARVPMTTIAAPFVHDTLPVVGSKSYVFDDDYEKRETSFWNSFQLPYLRLPGFQKIKNNDIVVFNQPADTLKDMNNFHPDRNYYKPIDKKTNLVKRCVGIAGDTLEIKNGYVFINGKQTQLPERAKPQYGFYVDTDNQQIPLGALKERYGFREGGSYKNGYYLTLTDEEAARLKEHPLVKSVEKQLVLDGVKGEVFPYIDSLQWNRDNYGPIYIPEEGATIDITKANLPFYKRIITEYEHNNLTTAGNDIFINGKKATTYTFKQNYYWMMGDNRHNSLDARMWGYVPFDHVVGKPVFIFMSFEKNAQGFDKIRWDRLFTTVGGSGKPVSYFWYAVVIGVLIYIGSKYYKKKKA